MSDELDLLVEITKRVISTRPSPADNSWSPNVDTTITTQQEAGRKYYDCQYTGSADSDLLLRSYDDAKLVEIWSRPKSSGVDWERQYQFRNEPDGKLVLWSKTPTTPQETTQYLIQLADLVTHKH